MLNVLGFVRPVGPYFSPRQERDVVAAPSTPPCRQSMVRAIALRDSRFTRT